MEARFVIDNLILANSSKNNGVKDSFGISFHWKDPHEWEYLRYDSAHMFLVLCYIVMFFMALYMFQKFRYTSKVFIATFLTGTFLRMLSFAVQPFIHEGIIIVASSLNFMLSATPSFLYFSSYTFLLLFWWQIFSRESQTREKYRRRIYLYSIIMNLIMYTVLITLYILDLVIGRGTNEHSSNKPGAPSSSFETAVQIFDGSLYISVSVGFFIYGYFNFRLAFYAHVATPLKHSTQRKKLLRKVGTITLVCMGTFLIRSSLVIWSALYNSTYSWWWVDAVYYLILEIIPGLLMLNAYLEPKNKFDNMNIPDSTSPLIE